jgi:hypothetical protein
MERRSARRWAQVGVMAAALGVGLLSGCGGDDDKSPQGVDPGITELDAHDGVACPDKLPRAEGPDTGLGGDTPAGGTPELQNVEEAWICEYAAQDLAPGPEGDGDPFEWVLRGQAKQVDTSLIQDLKVSLSELAPPASDLICTADLGPKWLLSYSTGGDLTGVTVDDFGCRSVRLTDEPFETVPGTASTGGMVQGYLAAPDTLLTQIKAIAG